MKSKRLMSLLLVITMVISMIPATVFPVAAATNTADYTPGDVNGDGSVTSTDTAYLRRYIAGGYNVSVNELAGDVNADGELTSSDVAYIRRYIAGGYDIELLPGLGPDAATYSVSFYDGDRLIDTLTAVEGEPLGAVPSVKKSSKANGILVGYYTDPAFTQPFYAENPVTGDMKVYAKYADMGAQETLNFTSFAQMDQQPDISFAVVGSGDPAEAITLEVKDGSDPVELKFEATADGYIVSAVGGFNEGCSYQLHLADGWTFKDKPDTIRTASFSIYKEQVENLRMSDDIVYIEDTDAIRYLIGGQTYDVLTASLITAQGGSFEYSDAASIKAGDILCIYTGKHPAQRGMDGDALDPVFYVTAKSVSGTTVTFATLGEDDFLKMYNIPDNFPIQVQALPAEETGTVSINQLYAEMYALMMGEGYDLAKAKASIEVGDFVSILVDKDTVTSENDIYFGQITAYNPETGEITYQKTTSQAILDSMDLYRDIEISGNDLVTDEQAAEIEAMLLSQISESGFAEDAAFMLADLITKTDGFQSGSLESLLITDGQGNQLTSEEIRLLNLGGTFELSDEVELTVEIIREGDQLHYAKGTQIAVGVEAEFEVELEDDEKIAIELNATFIQEVEISPRVKGYIIPYIIFFVPVPVGANVSGTVDIKSFTAFSFEAEVYTVAPEEESLWDQFKAIAEDPRKLTEIPGLPDELSKGLETVGDVFDKIEELEANMSKAQDKAEQYLGYAEDLEAIWDYVEANGLTTREDWAGMCDTLDKTSITSDLLDMMDLTNETELETEYYDSLEALMERYCEMVEKETDWVTLLEKDLFARDVFVYGVSIGIDVDFVVRADLSLAIGSNLQYEVGKRYEFWFEFAPFYKNSGSSNMDLLDERFAFQFYVMGRLGVKAGIRAKLEFGIGSCALANIGVSLELGPYMKLWGFFIYEYEKYRPAGTDHWISDQRMAGALLMEFGLYLKLAFEAEALSLFSYEYEFLDEEFPLLTIGEKNFYYQPNYEPEEDEVLLVKDVDGNSQNGITMTLPAYTLAMDYVDMREGYMAIEYLDYDRFHYTVSNPNFSIDPNTGLISVNVPDDTRYMECDLTVTYKFGKLAFSTYDMTVTVPLVWTNLATAELSEYYTAAVRMGNDADGYTTVWQKRLRKNQEFDLPSVKDIQDTIGWNEYKYDMGTGYGDQALEGLTLIEDEVYDFNVGHDVYAITVTGVENGTGSATFYAAYGETFDFSALKATGTTDYNSGVFTKFRDLNIPENIDLSKAIDTRMAEALKNGLTISANYMDNSATATFIFTGIDAEEVTIKLRRGDVPNISSIEALVTERGMAIKDIYPAIGAISSSTTYQVICGELDTEPATITFEENGGSDVADITKPYGSLIGNLPTAERIGHTFEGWFADAALTEPFALTKVPQGGATAYAKWTVNQFTVNFHVNGGNDLEEADASKQVAYGTAYGQLPKPNKTGYGFVGWFTAAEGGEQITAESVYNLTEDQTLYAQWRELKEISETIFNFGEDETFTYAHDTYHSAEYTFAPEEGATYAQNEFVVEYICEGYEDEGYMAQVMEVGTWGVKISRPADDVYAKFEAFYPGVLIIEKTTRTLDGITVAVTGNGFTYIDLKLSSTIFDLDENATFVYTIGDFLNVGVMNPVELFYSISKGSAVTAEESARLYTLEPNTAYTAMKVAVGNDRNYQDADIILKNLSYYTLGVPIGSWADNADISWYNETDMEFTIDTPAKLAGVAKLVNDGTETFGGKTIKLGNDIDLYGYQWTPIGTKSNPFRGTFDGQGYTISGLYVDTNGSYAGLFGYTNTNEYTVTEEEEDGVVSSTTVVQLALIQNLILDDSYVKGAVDAGGIVGAAHYTTITNCVSYARVRTTSTNEDASSAGAITGTIQHSIIEDCIGYGNVTGMYGVGGISGTLGSYSSIFNCINYGEVHGINSDGYGTGGIVGISNAGVVDNCVNLGNVNGISSVGGIVGLNATEEAAVNNCYSAGSVYGSKTGSYMYVGAVVGRNQSDDGYVANCYYLKNSARNGEDEYVLGGGTSKGSEDYVKNHFYTGSFTSLTSQIEGEKYTGGILIDVLNAYVQDVLDEGGGSIKLWVEDEDGYPVPDLRLPVSR